MKRLKNRIIVRVNPEQKDEIDVLGIKLSIPNKFNTNHREKNPVVCEVIGGNQYVGKGELLICHHNHFSEGSPYQVEDHLFSIPFNEHIFCKIDVEGNPISLCHNIISERIERPTGSLFLPGSSHYLDKVRVVSSGYGYKKGEVIFISPFADYEIVYHFNGRERRIIKVFNEFIAGVVAET